MTPDSGLMSLIHDRIAQLRDHPDVHLIAAHVLPPDPEGLAALCAATDGVLDPGMRRFYEACGGLWLAWTFAGHEGFSLLRGVTHDAFQRPAYAPYAGCVCVVPAREMLEPYTAEYLLDVLEPDAPPLSLGGRLVPPEVFARTVLGFSARSAEEGEALGWFADDDGVTFALLSSADQGTEWAILPDVDFTAYMRFTLGCFGMHTLADAPGRTPDEPLGVWTLAATQRAHMSTIWSLDDLLAASRAS